MTDTHPRLIDLSKDGRIVFGDGYRTRQDELGVPGVPILRVSEVSDGRIDPRFEDHVRDDFRGRFANKVSQAGDIVVTTKGTVGRIAQVRAGSPSLLYSPQVCFIRVIDTLSVNPSYLYYWFRGPEFRKQANAVMSQTDMADYINLRDFGRFRVFLPSEERQLEVVSILKPLDEMIEYNSNANRLLARLRDLLVPRLLSGEMDVQDLVSALDSIERHRMDTPADGSR
jgi:type I restriction enzyme S subunit